MIQSLFTAQLMNQSELPRPIPRNSVELDHGCTSRIYFDHGADVIRLDADVTETMLTQ